MLQFLAYFNNKADGFPRRAVVAEIIPTCRNLNKLMLLVDRSSDPTRTQIATYLVYVLHTLEIATPSPLSPFTAHHRLICPLHTFNTLETYSYLQFYIYIIRNASLILNLIYAIFHLLTPLLYLHLSTYLFIYYFYPC